MGKKGWIILAVVFVVAIVIIIVVAKKKQPTQTYTPTTYSGGNQQINAGQLATVLGSFLSGLSSGNNTTATQGSTTTSTSNLGTAGSAIKV
jgi:hypothetical protein